MNLFTKEPMAQPTITIYPSPMLAAKYVAQRVAEVIKQKQLKNQSAVLGLATGKTPVLVYQELIRLHREENLSFKNVISFNLDEYYPMSASNQHSYHWFMKQHLFNHIDIPNYQTHIPDGSLKKEALEDACQIYEQKIIEAGGIDLQLLGIGHTGHIGFNEPGTLETSTTRLVDLNQITREDAIPDFGSLDAVPSHAITMGVQTIAQARDIILMAWNQSKAEIIKKALQESVSNSNPASYLQNYKHVEFVLDHQAASLL